MTSPVPLDSNEVLTDVEHHFRVTAGPGAGKTYWLVKYIHHVAVTSKRLTPCSRIAVISYTNVAVREILRQLDAVANAVDASTIHSFLYRNLVRPYVHFLKDHSGQDLVAHHLVQTHGEHFPAYDHLDYWLTENHRRQLLVAARKDVLSLLKIRLQSLSVKVDGEGNAYFTPCKSEPRDKPIKDLLTGEKLLNYKRRFWKRGMVDHEDVLYFAHRLLREYPTLRRFLSARFPYLFIDEFQDTLPVQAAVVRWLADEGTIVGVIGDPEQAIFGFLDASADHFREFQLSGHRNYTIAGNRRSTDAIVSFLNRVRTDGLQQHSLRSETGVAPVVYGGNLADAINHARGVMPPPSQLLVLARKHDEVMRARRTGDAPNDDPWDLLQEADAARYRFLISLATSADLAQRRFYDIAIQRLVQGLSSRRGFRDPLQYDKAIDLTMRRGLALSLLEHIIGCHEELLGQSALELYNDLRAHVPKCLKGLKLKAVKTGKFSEAASACTYRDLVHALKTPDETRMTRTIHQAKGAEAPSVFVVLGMEQLDHILRPISAPTDDEPRITYVAVSRARDRLFLYSPASERLHEFEAMGLTTMVIGTSPTPPARKQHKSRRA